jgi:hypothetical protein
MTSRELGADLNAFLYRFGHRPVTDFEIADLVISAMEQKRREREAARATGVEQFMQWAEQAVFQFESLQTGEHAGSRALDASSLGLAPLQLGGQRAAGWGSEVRPAPRNIPGIAQSLASGDLSSLEDDEPPAAEAAPSPIAPAVAAAPISAPRPATGPHPTAPGLPESAAHASPEPAGGGMSGGAKVALLLLAIAGVLGGLYASGVIKHH